MPLALIGLWVGLSLLLILYAAFPSRSHMLRWPAIVVTGGVLGASLVLVWGATLEAPPRWHNGFAFDAVAHLLLPPLWAGAAGAAAVALFTPAGRYEPAIAALTAACATAGILSASPLLTIALLQMGAVIVLAGLLVHDQGLAGHPLLNVATSLKFLILTVMSGACLVMALLLTNFFALNPDHTELTRIAAAVLAVGFGLAVGAMPFYFSLPDVFDAAPTLAVTSLAGPLQCLAFVYLVRTIGNGPWLLTDQHVSNMLMLGALGGALLSATMGFGQRRLNRLLAFNAIREVSWIAFGLASMSRAGWLGALGFLAVRCVAQPMLITGGWLAQCRGEAADIEKLGGLRRFLPLTTLGWCAAAAASVGFPPAASMWGAAALFRASLDVGGLTFAAFLVSALLALWSLVRTAWALFAGEARKGLEPSPEPPVAAWLMASSSLGLVFAGFVPRLLQTPIQQLLASFPFLR